ncbi:hypothetical protein niasHT_017547 [Heterodera trifolii]|uniref:GOLD domain-containing protein n=1 Tax=Heterodera trifolii TaxID=157864 RepID=A0ABD2L673_9BILA
MFVFPCCQYDVDVMLEDPNGKVLYKEARKQLDTHTYKTVANGTYKVCFSNEFSTFSHKVVYLDWQTHHRLREATSRKRAEDLNERVTYWSLGQTAVVLLIGVGQVVLLIVVTGGQYDVDVVLEDPNGKVLYKEARKQLDTHTYKVSDGTEANGTYKVSFSNEFSTFSHKVVYLDWQVGPDEQHKMMPIPRAGGAQATQMERSAETISDRLKNWTLTKSNSNG